MRTEQRRALAPARILIAVAILMVLGGGGCGGSGDGSEAELPDFALADLEALSFSPDEIPPMEYQPDASGPGAFAADQEEEEEDEGEEGGEGDDGDDGDEGGESNAEFLRRLQRLGLEGDYVSQFFATSRDSELVFVESIVFLFEDDGAAAEAIETVATGTARNIAPAEAISAPELGDDSFGQRGDFDGFLTYTFGWRTGDAIQLITVAPGGQKAGPEATLELAEQLAAKAQR